MKTRASSPGSARRINRAGWLTWAVSAAVSGSCIAADETHYGICEHPTFTTDHARSAQLYKLMRRAGIGVTRSDFHWPALAGKDAGAPLDFSNFDEVVRTAKASNMALLPIVTAAPDYARPLSEHLDLWRHYVHALVSRYAGTMRYWEIWNEHDFADERYWGKEDVHAANYTRTLAAAYETIKKIDPGLTVVYGGTAHVPLEYIEKTLQNGAGNSFDVMNVHPYGSSTLPEAYLFEQLRGLKALMAKYGQEKKPIWATEIGWPSVIAPRPWIYNAVLPGALREIGIDPREATLGVLYDIENGFLVQSPTYDIAGNLPAFRSVRKVRLADLATLDVGACPVLVAAREEIVPRAFLGDLVGYVRRGGTIILPQGIPFGYDKPTTTRGAADPTPYLQDPQKALHMDVKGFWSLGISETDRISVPGFDPPAASMRNGRFLGEGNLEPGDRFLPLAYGLHGEKRYPFAGLYKLRSSLRGNVIVLASREGNVQEQVSREWQAHILPRAMLIMLSEGVEKIFWYKLTSSGVDADGDREQNFGILDKDLNPKPAYDAYTTLTGECPDGSSRPRITADAGVYRATWTGPDGRRVDAIWTAEEPIVTRLTLPGRVLRALDGIGRPIELGRLEGEITLTASPRISYLTTDPAARRVDPR